MIKIKKKILLLIFTIILILFWSPWMFDDGGEKTTRRLMVQEDYKKIIQELGDAKSNCDGVHSEWRPFGRRVMYCELASWYVSFFGYTVYTGPDIENISRLEYQKRLDDYVTAGGRLNACGPWAIKEPLRVVGELIAIYSAERVEDPYDFGQLEFKGIDKTLKIFYPNQGLWENDYKIGEFYTIDMNDDCLFIAIGLDSFYPSSRNNEYVYPEVFID